MNNRYIIGILYVHTGLMVLASTSFTIITCLWGNPFTYNLFQLSYRSGSGGQYKSEYSFTLVSTYIVAYILGIIAFSMALKLLNKTWTCLGIILSIAGLTSFLIESTHWLFNHHLSLILSSPLLNLFLALIVIIKLGKTKNKRLKEITSPDLASGNILESRSTN